MRGRCTHQVMIIERSEAPYSSRLHVLLLAQRSIEANTPKNKEHRINIVNQNFRFSSVKS